MTDRLWDFENSADASIGAGAVPPTPESPPSSPQSPGAPALVPPPVPRPPSPRVQPAPPVMPATISGPQSPPAAYGPPPAVGAGAAPAQPSLAPSRPPRPGERLLVETPVVGEHRSLWGWRALAAFVIGGLLAGLGFGIGSWNQRDDVSSTAAPTTTSVAEVPDTAPVIVQAPEIDSSEPAALVADVLGPSIVQVETPTGLGSGVVFRDGLVLTNNHVIEGAGSMVRVRTPDGRTFDADLVGADPRVDVAVLDIGIDPGLPVAELAVGETPQVGQAAIAIGSPFQLQQTVTSGIVSALNRPVPTGESAFTAMIQTDTAINPGNSGGALADRNGRVIGIITAIQTDGTTATNVGVGFAIPIDTAVRVADRIIAGESLEAGFLGVAGQPEPGETGIVITEVTPGSGAEAAGLVVGDRVIALDDAPVTSLLELAGLVQSSFVGDEVVLQVVRDGELVALNATLGAR